ncbi:hypothetical protein ASG12_13380 [Williamsia sp. Leaf354]|jgi:NAD/NADP transhydrogenase beta subunit|uniref:hypothetical protein n=1 Tax=Williamsia sp. Leaf354 TaxID=1736349 RepID=UPI0006FF3038|nr:hypothetical protein [Williamsia sp. Leaf354]KQR97982.1 hypothetical protein ASG12_13380 [Williamsia sp. Leaf354]
MRSRSAVTTATTVLALAAWTGFAGIYVSFGRFLRSDTSCDGGELRASTFGTVYLVIVAAVWMIPFVVLAVRKRSVPTTVLVVVAAIVGSAVVVSILSRPGEFCF